MNFIEKLGQAVAKMKSAMPAMLAMIEKVAQLIGQWKGANAALSGKLAPMFDAIKRTWLELAFLSGNLVTLSFLHGRIESPAIELLVFKALQVNAGGLHAHVFRKMFFPYIDFQTETDQTKKLLVVALYVVFIFAYARGG